VKPVELAVPAKLNEKLVEALDGLIFEGFYVSGSDIRDIASIARRYGWTG